jgi:hypothetical protein
MTILLPEGYSGDKNTRKVGRDGRGMQHVWEKKKAYRLLTGKTEGKRSLEISKCRLKN